MNARTLAGLRAAWLPPDPHTYATGRLFRDLAREALAVAQDIDRLVAGGPCTERLALVAGVDDRGHVVTAVVATGHGATGTAEHLLSCGGISYRELR